MKKEITLIISTFLFLNVFCQDNNSNTDFFNSNETINTNAVQKGNLIIEPWYGFPLWGKQIYTSIADTLDNFVYNGLGPFGGAVEFMLSDDVGLGVDFIYLSHAYSGFDQGIDAQGNPITYSYEFKMERIRVHLRMNYHFSQSENLDAYFGVGIGSNNRIFTSESNDPYWSNSSTTGALIPVSGRICVGTRYYFDSNFGFVIEAGLGGPLLRAGLSINI